MKVLSDPLGKRFAFPTDIRPVLKDTPVFRLRNLGPTELSVARAKAEDPRSFDLAPKQHVKAGRLNLERKPTFYGTLGTPLHGFYEVRAKPGDVLLCARFELAAQTNVTAIACPADFESQEPELVAKINLITGFIQRQFNRDAGPENEYNYSISHAIVDDYYTYPPALTSGWIYPSLQDNRFVNIAFTEANFKRLLRLHSVAVVRLEKVNETGAKVTNYQVLKRSEGKAYLDMLLPEDDNFVSVCRGLGFTVSNEMWPDIG